MDASNTQVMVMSARLQNKANSVQKRKGEIEVFDENIEFVGKKNDKSRNMKLTASEIDTNSDSKN